MEIEKDSRYWKRFRKKLLIHPKFQYAFMRYFVGIAGVTLFVFYAAKAFFFHHVQTYLIALGIPANHILFEFLTHQSHVMDAGRGKFSVSESRVG